MSAPQEKSPNESNSTTVSLCLLTWNEIEGCKLDVPQLPLDQFQEVYAVDAGSTDGTVQYLEQQGIKVHRQPLPSLNAACNFAFQLSNCNAVVLFHPKGTISPSDLTRFRPLFADGYEFVVASRNLRGGRNEEDDRLLKPRKWFVGMLSVLLSLRFRLSGPRMTDVLHGFRGMSVDAYKRIDPRETGSTIDAEMVIGSYRHNMRRAEFPTIERRRVHGSTHFRALPTGWGILKLVLAEATGRRSEEQSGT
jgi:glycosyltransferase involved in cell wall biosynthesis